MTWVYVLGGWLILAVIVAGALALVLRGRQRFNPSPTDADRAGASPPGSTPSTVPTARLLGDLVVLVAEDDARLQRIICGLLESDGRFARTILVGDGAAALTAARANVPDVVLLDVSMPVLGGLDILPHLRAIDPPPAVVLYTAEESSRVLREAQHYQLTLLPKSTPIDLVIDQVAAAGVGARGTIGG